MTGRVFISHADKDSALANALTDLLLTGLNLQTSNIFCSSLAGLGIPAGQDFKSYIKQELADSTVVIALLTPNYYASAFCLCEAGAAWVLSKDFLPFVVSNSTFGEMKAVLQGTQALRLEEETALDEMRERIEKGLSVTSKHAWWTKKKGEFLKKLSDIVASLEKPNRPSAKEYADALKQRDDYRQVSEELEERLNRCEKNYTEVAKLKDREAVAPRNESSLRQTVELFS
ncbi:MAG: toll/interleukin-1 receptor domain-containing protein [Terracidiphilus sp.]